MNEDFIGRWEKRWHPLRREWVVYSAHRNQRPWHGETEAEATTKAAPHSESCYLCPGNRRVSGAVNPKYESVFVFDNDHPVVGEQAPDANPPAAPARGVARVCCYHPRHDLSVGDLAADQVVEVVKTWADETAELGAREEVLTVQVFENRGEACGTSSTHPHCQIYATDFVMGNASRTLEAIRETPETFDRLLAFEREDPRRVVAESETAIAFVPYFARFPYEVWIFPKEPAARLHELSPEAIQGLAELYRTLNRGYDALFGSLFPYVMAVNQAPTDGRAYPKFKLHMSFYPPLRAPGLRKMIAGAELGGGNFMNDTVPEETATRLRDAIGSLDA